MMSSMKRPNAANDNEATIHIARTRELWEHRLGRELSADEALQFQNNMTGFFGVLLEWSQVERPEPANDTNPQDGPGIGEGRHEP